MSTCPSIGGFDEMNLSMIHFFDPIGLAEGYISGYELRPHGIWPEEIGLREVPWLTPGCQIPVIPPKIHRSVSMESPLDSSVATCRVISRRWTQFPCPLCYLLR